MAKLYQSKGWMVRMYLLQKLSIPEIAKRAGTSEMTIYRYLREYGILGKR